LEQMRNLLTGTEGARISDRWLGLKRNADRRVGQWCCSAYEPSEGAYPAIHYNCAPYAGRAGFPFERKIPWGRADLRS
jgi:hypothetical protein